MPRRLRLQYPGAIYHVMARGNARQHIVRDDDDRRRLRDDLARAAVRCGWRVYAFVFMSNHLHLVLKTPEPNLARGMQGFLSSYANAWARRHRFSGHVFQGRYRTELVEDETYVWTVTRYVHLNPVRARLVEHPAAWPWSSYLGYARRDRRLEWVAYDELLTAWGGEFGGSDPAGAYRRYVTAGLAEPPSSPWSEAHHGWAPGSPGFLARLRGLVRPDPPRELRREAREMRAVDLSEICEVVCRAYGIEPSELGRRGSRQERASGAGVPGAPSHGRHELGAGRVAGGEPSGQRAEPDAAVRRLARRGGGSPRTVGGVGGGIAGVRRARGRKNR